jgi:hypothetical protein
MDILGGKIASVHIWSEGDRSVGLDGQGAVIHAAGDFLIDLDVLALENRQVALEAFRQKIIEAFTLVWEAPAKAIFDIELADDAQAAPQHVDFRFQDGRTESVDVSKAEHVLELGGFAPKV